MQIMKINLEDSTIWTICEMNAADHFAKAPGKRSDFNPPETGWKLTQTGEKWLQNLKDNDKIPTNTSPNVTVQRKHKKGSIGAVGATLLFCFLSNQKK
eukprot:UN13207